MPTATLTIEQIRSPIRRPSDQRNTLIGLRLNRIGRFVALPDTPATRGMVAKVAHLVRVVYATSELDAFVAETTAEYRDILIGSGSRIVRGNVLWDQFEAAVTEYHASHGKNDRRLIEVVNELAVAKVLVDDPALQAAGIEYEPDLLPDGRKIDFVLDRGRDNLYVEVKTVRPLTKATREAYSKFEKRKAFHPKNVEGATKMNIAGSVAMVTGANRGIGKALVEALQARGAVRRHPLGNQEKNQEPA